jgi:site-specific recombinase XerD
MNDDTAIVAVPDGQIVRASPVRSMAEAANLARECNRVTKLTRYQEGLRPETLRRQKTDLLTFAQFLESIGVVPGDFYNDLDAWQDITADLIETFIDWQKRKGYAIASINVRLATVKAYCHGDYPQGTRALKALPTPVML